ncbi:MAG: hypothetical protein OT477_20945 [Chloroflexi bacterium]|nr:hypothetical protein [Chloroflexota bacterium]
MILYFLMAFLFLILASLEALGVSLISVHLIAGYSGLRWLRVHLITLGVLTELIFGTLPALMALHDQRPRPAFSWPMWLLLNGGLLTLMVGIPLVNAGLIITGGTLIFVATSLLMWHLWQLRPAPTSTAGHSPTRKFYLTGLAYFLFGIFVGTGLWFGWPEALNIAVPLEVHIHANNWGLMSLVFAGLILDYYPQFAGRPLAWPRTITPIYWLMTLGALGLVLGPWTGSLWFTVPGLVMHLVATLLVVVNMVKPLWGNTAVWSPGMWHLTTAYIWILAPVMVAPLIILGVPGFPGMGVEQNAPQALIYGWVLQVGFALVPYLFRLFFAPRQPARLGGNWFSLAAVHLGGVLLWLGIFFVDARAMLHGGAYALWAVAFLPIVWEVGQVMRGAVADWEEATAVASHP